MTNNDKNNQTSFHAVMEPAQWCLFVILCAKFFLSVLEKLYQLDYGDIDDGDEKNM
jgi:hypothetical protein